MGGRFVWLGSLGVWIARWRGFVIRGIRLGVRTEGSKTRAKAKAIDRSLRPSGFAPAFGRAEAPLARLGVGTPEGVPFHFARRIVVDLRDILWWTFRGEFRRG